MKRILQSTISLSLAVCTITSLATPVTQNKVQAKLISRDLVPSRQVSSIDRPRNNNILLNDLSVKMNWGLNPDNKASINAGKAWNITKGSKDIVVAVIDTGIDVNHSYLKENLWVNKGEQGLDSNGKNKATNRVDDDGNGFVDDVHGWNFVANDHDLTDNHNHGTHIAGIIAAKSDDNSGVVGVAPGVSVMVLKYYDPKSKFNSNLANTIKAIHYAIKMKADIINYSGGGLEYSAEEFAAVKLARQNGILFVAASGNEYSNSDVKPYYPADYDLDNVISVTAINPSAQVLPSSNFGKNSVHIAAPGKDIVSTLPGHKNVGPMTGTSQATAFVSGVAALILSQDSSNKYLDVRNQILATADSLPGLEEKTKTSGKLNAWAALAVKPATGITGIKAQTNLKFFNNETALNNEQLNELSFLSEITKQIENAN